MLCELGKIISKNPKCFSLKPLPCWTSYPHPKYSSLTGLFGRINELSESGSTNIPKLVLIENGIHDEGGNIVKINISISIVGESREHCIVIGGLEMEGKKEDDVNVRDLTLRNSTYHGICGWKGASIHLNNVDVENSKKGGVVINATKRNSMTNCRISTSKESGLSVGGNGLMKVYGTVTTIHHNCTGGDEWAYGLETDSSSSNTIFLVSPLSKESISVANFQIQKAPKVLKKKNYKEDNNSIKIFTEAVE